MTRLDEHTLSSVSKVAMVDPVGGHAGMNYYDIELCKSLHFIGIHCHLYTCDETTETSEEDVIILKPFVGIYGRDSLIMRGWRFLTGLIWTARDIKRHSIKTVHLHYFQYGIRELACCAMFKALRVSVVATVHDVTAYSQPRGPDLFKAVIGLTDQIIVHNNFCAEMLSLRYGEQFELPSVSVIKHGNYLGETERADRPEARRLLGLPSEEPVLLFFGQIKPEKGLTELLNAFALYKEGNAPGFLIVAGRPVEGCAEDYQKMASDLGLSSYIRFDLRYIPDDEARDYYSAADLVVLPYREIYSSAVLLMAMSYGKAVLCSDLAPMQEVVEEGITGFFFKAGSVGSLTTAIERALHDRDALRAIGNNALVEMKESHGWHEIAEHTKEIYEIASGRSTAAA